MSAIFLPIFVAACTIRGVAAGVNVTVQPLVTVHIPTEDAVLQCDFEKHNKSALVNILWGSTNPGGWKILQKDSNGKISTGTFFSDTAHFGSGCTLMLRNPTAEYNGDYYVKVYVTGEGLGEAVVQLVVKGGSDVAFETTTKTPNTTHNSDSDVTSSANTEIPKTKGDTGNSLSAGLGISVSLVFILLVLVVYLLYRCRKHGGTNNDISLKDLDLSQNVATQENGDSTSCEENGDAKSLPALE